MHSLTDYIITLSGYPSFIAILLGVLGFIFSCVLITIVVLEEFKYQDSLEEQEEHNQRIERQLSLIKR
jgi:hypothetical protein